MQCTRHAHACARSLARPGASSSSEAASRSETGACSTTPRIFSRFARFCAFLRVLRVFARFGVSILAFVTGRYPTVKASFLS